jgi:hypothetical protein
MDRPDPELPPDPVIDAYKKDVDLSLIHAQLRRSIDERVQTMLGALAFAEALHETGRRQPRS